MTENNFWKTVPAVDKEKFLMVVTSFNELSAEEVSYKNTFESLGFDSLDFIECVMFLENDLKTEVKDEDLEGITTVGELAELFSASLQGK